MPISLQRLAPAKLNLGLHVLRRRSDGFHDLKTTFLPVSWADQLDAVEAGTLSLATSDPALPTDSRNLVVRAAERLAAHVGMEPLGHLWLDKRVPYGAGLGSGSSDAAATLRLLCDLWQTSVSDADLHALALGLGSDVPFFLDARPSLATGRGEVLSPLLRPDGSAWACPFWIVVAVPPVHVSTARAYGLVTPNDRDRPDLAAAVVSADLDRWRHEIVNDFEAPVVARHPAVGAARDALRSAGAGYAAMSGSGSAVFGVFESPGAARAAAGLAEETGCRTHVEAPG